MAAAATLDPEPEPESDAGVEPEEPPLRAVHWLVMSCAVLVTISVWGFVVFLLLRPAKRHVDRIDTGPASSMQAGSNA
jgi:hypothetical protein